MIRYDFGEFNGYEPLSPAQMKVCIAQAERQIETAFCNGSGKPEADLLEYYREQVKLFERISAEKESKSGSLAPRANSHQPVETYGMCTAAGNQAVAEMIRELPADYPSRAHLYEQLTCRMNQIAEQHGEVYDTAVREAIIRVMTKKTGFGGLSSSELYG
jgi:hypothetical protein